MENKGFPITTGPINVKALHENDNAYVVLHYYFKIDFRSK